MNRKTCFGSALLCTVVYISIEVVSVHALGDPQYESEWMLLVAQVSPAELRAPHGLGVVPAIVDVLVKAIDGPNKDFIFKADGTAERDDGLTDPYGGVVYIYNENYVRVMAPYYLNDYDHGSVLYTGSDPYWTGINSQSSNSVMVKVRCWTEEKLPPTCFNAIGIHMHSGSSEPTDTFRELHHGNDGYPDLVKVRVLLTNSVDAGWYSDGQGAAKMNFDTAKELERTGGLKFAYNDETIRVWTSAASYSYLESHTDGWGNDRVNRRYSDTGLVEVRVWCNLATMYEQRLPFGPSVVNEQFELQLDLQAWSPESVTMSVTVEAVDGPNVGYRFEGSGSGYTNTQVPGTPCAYGGVINAYSAKALRFWRPNSGTGGSICIPMFMGDGTYAQSSLDGILVVKIWRHPTMKMSKYEPLKMVCSHFKLLQEDTAYSAEAIDIHSVSNIVTCDRACRHHESCITYEYYNATCSMYNATEESLFYPRQGSQVWGLEDRTVNIED